MVESGQQKAGELVSTATETAERVAEQAQVHVQRVEQAVGRWMDDNPIALGAVALAAGTALGLALPRTENEDPHGCARRSVQAAGTSASGADGGPAGGAPRKMLGRSQIRFQAPTRLLSSSP